MGKSFEREIKIEITKELYEQLEELKETDRSQFSKEIYKLAQGSEYKPEIYGCILRNIKQESDKYYACWSICFCD